MGKLNVDYELLFPKTVEISEKAGGCYTIFQDVYNNLVTMHNTWNGTQWDNFVTVWNAMQNSLDNNLRYIVKAVPETLEGICVNYSIR